MSRIPVVGFELHPISWASSFNSSVNLLNYHPVTLKLTERDRVPPCHNLILAAVEESMTFSMLSCPGFWEKWILVWLDSVLTLWFPGVLWIGNPSWIHISWFFLKMPLMKGVQFLLLIFVRNQNNLTIILVELRFILIWNRAINLYVLRTVERRKRLGLSRYL